VFELRDLWPESIHAVGALAPSLPLRLLERLELRMYRQANAVVCVTRAFMDNLAGRGIEPEKLHFVPNGIVPAEWEGGARTAGRARLGVEPDEIAVCYAGTLGMAHGLGTVLEAAQALEAAQPRARFFIVGDGAERCALEGRAAALGLRNVVFTGLLPRNEIVDVMAAADVALVTLKPVETFRSVLPSKMFEAMAAGKPVVLGVDGEARSVLERAGAGVAVPPGEARALAGAIAALAANAEERERLGAAGRAFVAREFNRTVWAGRYLAILEGVIRRSRAGVIARRQMQKRVTPAPTDVET
jgi:glycosyltransferase involved in cell wall biosynthesis